ncbi:MAG: cytochrome d ubiquinol oxidase subunit II [Muribaculaceae bacterium]|nr:cytochrome d ubiquinol oxidase subunit II [Muribaculaceae bacterium]
MLQIEHLQEYWWLLISVLGALLVFLLFVQGGQSMLLSQKGDSLPLKMMVTSLGHKWELTFTTLVVFGGAFFASFPLFYSTSFGGAYWLWMLILFSFILQAVSYEFRAKQGNLFGTRVYDVFLFINGCMGCILLGVAVAGFFNPNCFTVSMGNILDPGSPVISVWAPTRGLEAIFSWFNLLLGFAVLFLARTQACLYFMNNISEDPKLFASLKKRVLLNGLIFVVLFVAWLVALLVKDGYQTVGLHEFEVVPFKYFLNYVDMWWCLVVLLIGVVLVLYAIGRSALTDHFTKGIWYSGLGTVLVVLTLFWVAGYNNTPFYPSVDLASSLTIANASSSEFTLTVMSWVSLLVPFVVAYIAYAWYAMDRKKLTPTSLDH